MSSDAFVERIDPVTEQLLNRLTATWRAHGVPGEEALAPGSDVAAFTSDDGSLHVALPTELRTWWAWHDGHVTDWKGRAWPIGPSLTPFTSAESRDQWQWSMEKAHEMAADAPKRTLLSDPDYWWRSSWVPLR